MWVYDDDDDDDDDVRGEIRMILGIAKQDARKTKSIGGKEEEEEEIKIKGKSEKVMDNGKTSRKVSSVWYL